MMTSDWTKVDLTVDPRSQRMVGRTNYGQFFDVPYMTEIAPNLWQGGCANGLVLPTDIKHLLSLYPWESYTINHRMRTRHEVTMYDDPTQDTSGVDKWARWVNKRRETAPVLVHCQAGLNRSSLIVARALMLAGMPSSTAIDTIREKRSPACLCNPGFESYLRSL